MKSKIFISTLLLIWTICSLPLSSAEEKQEPLSIALIDNNPPFSFKLPNGNPTGLYTEFWMLWSETNGIPVSLVLDEFVSGVEAVKNNQIDIHSGLFKKKDRSEWANFSIPIHRIHSGVLYNDDYPPTTNLEEMLGKKVAAHKGSFQADYIAENYPQLELVRYDEIDKIFYSLLNNEVQAIVSEIPFLKAKAARLGFSGVFNLSEEVLFSNEVYAVVAKENNHLIKIINKGIENIPIDELVKLEKKWLPGIKPFFRDSDVYSTLSVTERSWLKSHSHFTMGVDQNYYPFEFIDEQGEHSGITAEYVQYAKDKLGIDMDKVSGYTWTEALEALKAGKIDIMPGVVKTESRSMRMHFTDPLITIPIVIVAKNNSSYVAGIEDLVGKTVGVIAGFAESERMSKDYPELNLHQYDSVIEALQNVQSGNTDVFVAALAVVNLEIKKYKMLDLSVVAFTPYSLDLSMAVRNGLKPLVGILNKVINSMDSRQRGVIANNWLSVHVKNGTDLKTMLLWTLPFALMALLIIFVIIRTNRRMEIEIVERQKIESSLAKAKEAAEAANSAKDEFLANMSHEIRTPMNAVVGMSHLLEESGLNTTQQIYLNTLQTSTSSLLILINDILDLSKIEAGKLELEVIPFSLKGVLSDIASQVRFQLVEQAVIFKKNIDPTIPEIFLGDPLRLSQILLNLTFNAVKFTQKGEITLTVVRVEQQEDKIKLRFTISDTGIGMTDEQLQHIFKTYSQADTSTTRKYGGSGLGLSICRNLTELMGGTISAESTIGVGSAFSFTVVFTCLSPDAPEAIKLHAKVNTEDRADNESVTIGNSDRPSKLTGKRILIVDDNQVNLMVAAKILDKKGLVVKTAMEGEQSLKMLQKESFDAVLMDIQMPVMDGYEATKRIRANPEFKRLPIIALSANVMKDSVNKSLHAGMNAHLGKPLDVETLLDTLEQHIP